jgi:hypothetical protein
VIQGVLPLGQNDLVRGLLSFEGDNVVVFYYDLSSFDKGERGDLC